MPFSYAQSRRIEIASGEFLAFIDDDDEWLAEKLSKQVEVLLNSPPEVGLIYSGLIALQDGFSVLKRPKHKGNIYRKQLHEDHIFSTSTWLIKRQCIEDGRIGLFDERLPARQDYDFTLRLLRYYSVDYCNEILVNVHKDAGECISNDVSRRVQGHLMVLKKINSISDISYFAKLTINSSHYYSIARYYQAMGKINEARRYLKKAIKEWPLNCRAIIFHTLFYIGDENTRVYRAVKRVKKILERK